MILYSCKIYDESEILKLISQGDEHAFAKLFKHHQDKIYSVAFKLTHSVTTAKEIVEDVFLKIWLRRSSLLDVHDFPAYLFIITRNEAYRVLKQIARNYQFVELKNNSQLLADNNADDVVIEKEYNSIFREAVNRLPEQQKLVYNLIKETGLKRNEAADFLHLTPETVKFHLAQAMKNIRSFCALHLDTIIFIVLFSIL